MADNKNKPTVPATNPTAAKTSHLTPSVPDEGGKAMETRDHGKPDESEGGVDGNAETGSKFADGPQGSKLSDKHSGEGHITGLKERGKKVTAETDVKAGQNFVAGFNFDMYSLTEMYSNIRDGNYWSAFRMAVEILHQNFNPYPPMMRGTNRNVTTRTQEPVRMSQVIDAEENLQECCDHLRNNVKAHNARSSSTGIKEPLPGTSQEKNVEVVDVMGLIALVEMILGFVRRFRESRGS